MISSINVYIIAFVCSCVFPVRLRMQQEHCIPNEDESHYIDIMSMAKNSLFECGHSNTHMNNECIFCTIEILYADCNVFFFNQKFIFRIKIWHTRIIDPT